MHQSIKLHSISKDLSTVLATVGPSRRMNKLQRKKDDWGEKVADYEKEDVVFVDTF